MTNSSMNVRPSARSRRIDLRSLAWFSFFALAGGLIVIRPIAVLVGLIVAAILGLCRLAIRHMQRSNLELWQVLSLVAVSAYLLLSRGFENLTLHVGGIPLIVGYALIYSALVLAIFSQRQLIARALKEPSIVCMLALLALSAMHLLVELPSYGIWALRDSTICLDGIFMLLGLAWALKPHSSMFLARWMMGLFVLNMLYAYTMPWGEKVWGWSPVSGVFLKVPLLGEFSGTGDLLVLGALFCICVGNYLIKRPSWLMLALAIGQFLGISITQGRRTYVGTAVAVLILLLLGEAKKFAKLFILVPSALLVVFLVTSVAGLKIEGRIGEVNLDFLKAHLKSVRTSEGTPGSSIESRFSMADEALGHFRTSPVLGVGFGKPLVSDIDETNGAVTRMPHNSSLSILARLGVVGFVFWIAFHFLSITRFVAVLRMRSTFNDQRVSSFVLWLFLFYVLFVITSLVEAPFEFPSGAVPFYFFTGFALGLMRWQLSKKVKRGQSQGALLNKTEWVHHRSRRASSHGLVGEQFLRFRAQ